MNCRHKLVEDFAKCFADVNSVLCTYNMKHILCYEYTV